MERITNVFNREYGGPRESKDLYDYTTDEEYEEEEYYSDSYDDLSDD